MKKLLVLLITLLLSNTAVFSQNAYRVLRSAGNRVGKVANVGNTRITRHITAPASSANLAKKVVQTYSPNYTNVYFRNTTFRNKYWPATTVPQVVISTEFKTPILRNPSTLWGSYRYLKELVRLSQERGAVAKGYEKKWRNIRDVSTYRGVHHIVNKSTLKEIYTRKKIKAQNNHKPYPVHLGEMQNDAPGIIHPFHGNPEYQVMFHNINRQLALYDEGGVRAIILDYFNNMQELHRLYPREAPVIYQEMVDNTLKEAQLWAETYRLRWK
ncbi:hypothetical protein [Candidatus Avelusimicrobium faecicola]|uniref:hypothetical protein n=1 Tax=Candidatus Avelusimicrobium faecicola TaxID=3416205 RepID=UPI00204DA69E|nr:MAG TPA: hypothetical protein [Caudoviricetes sp.]